MARWRGGPFVLMLLGFVVVAGECNQRYLQGLVSRIPMVNPHTMAKEDSSLRENFN
jgi:hypothetical protein